jgi:para-nitrobenzyl esterase
VFQDERLPTWDWGPADRRLAAQMAAYWTNFAKTGDPNGPGLPAWPRFTQANRQVMLLEAGPRAAELPGWSRLQLIDEMIAHFR